MLKKFLRELFLRFRCVNIYTHHNKTFYNIFNKYNIYNNIYGRV